MKWRGVRLFSLVSLGAQCDGLCELHLRPNSLPTVQNRGGGSGESISKLVPGTLLHVGVPPPRHVVLGRGGHVRPQPVPPCGAALCRVGVGGWVGAWGAPLQRSPWWGGMSLA